MRLSELKTGEKGVIVKVLGNINDGKTWTPLQALPENMQNADYSSVIAWGNQLYILADNDL